MTDDLAGKQSSAVVMSLRPIEISSAVCPHLVDLRLTDAPLINIETFSVLCTALTQLTHLTIRGCPAPAYSHHPAPSVFGLQELTADVKHLAQLQELLLQAVGTCLSICSEVGSLSRLTKLSLGCAQPCLTSLARLPALRILTLDGYIAPGLQEGQLLPVPSCADLQVS